MVPSHEEMSRVSSGRRFGVILVMASTTAILGIPFLDRWIVSQALVPRSIGRTSAGMVTNDTSPATILVPTDDTPPETTIVPPDELPEVAWLMTFPNSGTTYTLQLIQKYTNTTTATNYGNEQAYRGTNVPVHPWLENGPFPRYPTWNLPPRYILTKTHCGGTRLSPQPTEYIETPRSFEVSCRSGSKMVNGTKVDAKYSMDVPKRAVHLIRNPFDNIVARLHHEEKRWQKTEDKVARLAIFNSTKEGFRTWCLALDSVSVNVEQDSHFIDEELLEIARKVPCHGELIRYTYWHTMAMELTRRKTLPVHYLFYEDYTNDWNKTVEELFRFIEISPAPGFEPLEFITGKHYADYFDPQDITMAKELVKALASPESWDLLKRYFPQ